MTQPLSRPEALPGQTYRVHWPDSEDAPCKDANETLMQHGADVLRECIEAAEPYPITGLHRMTVSPSSSKSRRSTPWVEGCCGPMLMIIVS